MRKNRIRRALKAIVDSWIRWRARNTDRAWPGWLVGNATFAGVVATTAGVLCAMVTVATDGSRLAASAGVTRHLRPGVPEGMVFVWIAPGNFLTGPDSGREDEKPAHPLPNHNRTGRRSSRPNNGSEEVR